MTTPATPARHKPDHSSVSDDELRDIAWFFSPNNRKRGREIANDRVRAALLDLAHARAALRQIEAHHVELCRLGGRQESESRTLAMVRGGLARGGT